MNEVGAKIGGAVADFGVKFGAKLLAVLEAILAFRHRLDALEKENGRLRDQTEQMAQRLAHVEGQFDVLRTHIDRHIDWAVDKRFDASIQRAAARLDAETDRLTALPSVE